jgi:hypothetical protein
MIPLLCPIHPAECWSDMDPCVKQWQAVDKKRKRNNIERGKEKKRSNNNNNVKKEKKKKSQIIKHG